MHRPLPPFPLHRPPSLPPFHRYAIAALHPHKAMLPHPAFARPTPEPPRPPAPPRPPVREERVTAADVVESECVVGRAAASEHCRLVRGTLVKLGFPLNPTKTVWPCRRMEALGADAYVDVDSGAATLASSKAEKYARLVADALLRKSLPCDELQSLVAELVYKQF